jgi:acyl-CoA thioester hydrolase
VSQVFTHDARHVRTVLRTRPNDLDSLRHVNHAVALEYMELGRWDWFSHNGLRRAGGVTPVVARCDVQYLRQIFAGEVVVNTHVSSNGDDLTYKVIFEQTLSVLEGSAEILAVSAQVTAAFIDLKSSRVCSFQEFLAQSASGARSGSLIQAEPE